jgi:cytochrome c-type biogenesis protein CcmH
MIRRLWLAVLAAGLWLGTAHAFIQPDERLADPQAEARAEDLGDLILCPVCDGQSINGSNADVAVAMRRAVRQQVQAGNSDAQILDWFRERYGQGIISHPPLTLATAFLWLTPVLIITIGGFFISKAFFKTKKE